MEITDIRQWLLDQRRERVPGEGLRAIAKETGVHENTLYGICRGAVPHRGTIEKLTRCIETKSQQ